MTKTTHTKQFTFAALAAILLTAATGVAVLAAGTCTTPTPDCPMANCDQ